MVLIGSETERLRSAIVRAPSSFVIREPINPTQAHFFSTVPPERSRMISEQGNLCALLQKRGVELIHLSPSGLCPYEVFTRDIGFVINDLLFLANMAKPIRSEETASLLELTTLRGWSLRRLKQRPIEGGDILVDGDVVYIGISGRTSEEAFQELESVFTKGVTMVPISLADHVLHLDCVFNILPKGIIFCHLPSMKNGLPSELRQRRVIPITDDEAFGMGGNVLSLDENTVILQPRHERLINLLQGYGLEVLQIDLTETTKLGGSSRCMVMPLIRGNCQSDS